MLILASSSKARHRLLDQVGIEHKIFPSDVDEEKFVKANIDNLVLSLAKAKAQSVASKIYEEVTGSNDFLNAKVVLGCDSLFEFEGEIFGKPSNAEEAANRLRAISSKAGFLFTGHCLINLNNPKITNQPSFYKNINLAVIKTKINFSEISNDEIDEYVGSGEPLQCAGGFSIDGKGALFIQSIEGCFSNVIGLSLPWLRGELLKMLEN